jgi:hypothetical protein
VLIYTGSSYYIFLSSFFPIKKGANSEKPVEGGATSHWDNFRKGTRITGKQW